MNDNGKQLVPWRRYAFIADLVRCLSYVSPPLTKHRFHRLVFLLQEVLGIDCGYDFEQRPSGPFSTDLSIDLDQVDNLGGVILSNERDEWDSCVILPGPAVDKVRQKAKDCLDEVTDIDLLDLLRDTAEKMSRLPPGTTTKNCCQGDKS